MEVRRSRNIVRVDDGRKVAIYKLEESGCVCGLWVDKEHDEQSWLS